MKIIFDFIDKLLKNTKKIGEYDQKIQKDKYSKNNLRDIINRKIPNNLPINCLLTL